MARTSNSGQLAAEKIIQPDVNQTMDSYYAEEVFDEDANGLAGLFTPVAGAVTKERRSAETQGLRRVTQADLLLSFLPHPNEPTETETPIPDPVPAPVILEDELGRFTPRQYRAPRVDKVYGGEDLMCEDRWTQRISIMILVISQTKKKCLRGLGIRLRATQISKEFWNGLMFLMSEQLRESRSMPENGSKKNKA
jgi:hypothetical protein